MSLGDVSLLVGCALLLAGVWHYWRQRHILARCLRTTGTVTALLRARQAGDTLTQNSEQGRGMVPKYHYRPQIRFTTRSGEQVNFAANLFTRPPQYEVGAQVPVAYDPRHPQRALLDTFLNRWFHTLALLGFGVFFLLMGWLGYQLG